MYLAVALELSILLANCLTLLAGKLFKSMLLSLMVFDTNSSSLRKNQNISLCTILAVSCGYFAKLIWACTSLYHSSTEWSPWRSWLTGQTLLWLHLSMVYRTLQIWSKWHPSTILLGGASTRIHTGLFQNLLTRLSLSCIFLSLQALQAHIPICFHILTSISGTCL